MRPEEGRRAAPDRGPGGSPRPAEPPPRVGRGLCTRPSAPTECDRPGGWAALSPVVGAAPSLARSRPTGCSEVLPSGPGAGRSGLGFTRSPLGPRAAGAGLPGRSPELGGLGAPLQRRGPRTHESLRPGGDAGNRPTAEEVGAQRPLWAQVLLWAVHCVVSRSLQLKNQVEGGGWLAASRQGAWPSGSSPAAREVLLTRRLCESSLKAADATGRLSSPLGPLRVCALTSRPQWARLASPEEDTAVNTSDPQPPVGAHERTPSGGAPFPAVPFLHQALSRL